MLFLGPKVQSKIDSSNSMINALGLTGGVLAAFNVWTVGDYIHDNGKGGPGFLKRLKPPPPEIWEIRITHPSPQLRVFGRFAAPDIFVAFDIWTRDALRKIGSASWRRACAECASDWSGLFGSQPPHSGKMLSDYVMEKFDELTLQ